MFLLLLQWEAKAWSSHHRDGGMTGWEGAADGLQERLVFNAGLGVPIIPQEASGLLWLMAAPILERGALSTWERAILAQLWQIPQHPLPSNLLWSGIV